MANESYIYYDSESNHFSQNRKGTTGDFNGVQTRFIYYDVSPDKAITGIRLSVVNTRAVTLYKGEKGSGDPNTAGHPITEIVSDPETTGEADVFLAFDATTFGNDEADRLVLGLEQEGTGTPDIGIFSSRIDIDFYAAMIAFPDGFFDKIVPSRTDRGGGTIELADGTLVQYKGFGGNRWRWKLGAKFVDKLMLDRLDALYTERPEFFFAQEPDRYPNRIYRCILESPVFRVPWTTQWKGNGYSIEMDIAQV